MGTFARVVRATWGILLLMLLSALVACDDETPAAVCIPGDEHTCACAAQIPGVQRCSAAGAYSACNCDVLDGGIPDAALDGGILDAALDGGILDAALTDASRDASAADAR